MLLLTRTICFQIAIPQAFLVAQMIKKLPAMQKTRDRSLGWGDALEKGMATHSSILAWRIPWMRSLVGYSPWSHKESDTTEGLTFSLSCLGVGLLNCRTTLLLVFWGTSILFSIVSAPVHPPAHSTWEFPLLYTLHTLILCCLFDNKYSDMYEVISHCGFDFYFLMISDVEHLSMCQIPICMPSL